MATPAQKRARRRRVLPGFPVEPFKMTQAERDAYFSQDKIQCLICGQHKNSLSLHLQRLHGMEDDDYRDMFGLPIYMGLVGTITRQNYAETATNWITKEYFASQEQAALARAAKAEVTRKPFLVRNPVGRDRDETGRLA